METNPSGAGANSSGAANNVRLMIYGFIGLIGAALIASAASGAYRVYHYTALDSFSVGVAKALHLPALKVNGEPVPYTDYVADLRAIKLFRDFSKTSGAAGADFTDAQLSDQVLSRLATNIIVAQAGKRLGAVVTADDTDKLKAQLLEQFKTVDVINAELTKRYGWDLATYERKVMQPYILENKLGEKLQSDPATRAAIRQQADAVLQQIKNGGDFAALAKQYGSDGTAAQGGDLGWFKKGDMVPQFEAAAFALKPGSVSDIVETAYGFHIIKLEGVRTNKVKDPATGKMVDQAEVHARHILFAFPTVNSFLGQEVKNAKINLYLNVHNPFTVLTATSTPTP